MFDRRKRSGEAASTGKWAVAIDVLSDGAGGGKSGSPRPLKVETAEMARHVNRFSDEEETGVVACFHSSGVEAGSIDSASGDFGFFEPLSAGGVEAPVMQAALGRFDGGVGPALWSGNIGEMGGEALRPGRGQRVAEGEAIASGADFEQWTQQTRGFWSE